MDAKEFCRKIYRETIEKQDTVPSELKRALRTHERVPAFIDNLAKELLKVNPRTSRVNLELAVRDLTLLFVGAVKTAAEQKALSPLALALKQSQIDKAKELENTLTQIEKGATHATQNKNGLEVSFENLEYSG